MVRYSNDALIRAFDDQDHIVKLTVIKIQDYVLLQPSRLLKKMRILVLGAYGMLGHSLLRGLGDEFDVLGTCRCLREDVPEDLVPRKRLIEDVDAFEMTSVKKAILLVRPDAVINCIGIVKQSPLANDPVVSISINSLFPHKLAALCNEEGIGLIHFSTDCVFSGRRGHYTPNDLPDAEDLYGRSKALGEPNGRGVVTIRSSIIGRELGTHNGLVEWLALQRGKRVKGFMETYFTGFTTKEMGEVIRRLLQRKGAEGLWHVASERISKHDLISLINQELDLGVQIEPEKQMISDRSLDGSSFNKEFDYRPKTWKEMAQGLARDWHMYDDINGA